MSALRVNSGTANKKTARRRSLDVFGFDFVQAVIAAVLFFRRYATKPMPANPISSIAHVEGSGTGALPKIGVSFLRLSEQNVSIVGDEPRRRS